MENYKIPKVYLPGFEIISKLDEKDFRKIVNSIKKMTIGTGIKSFSETLNQSIKVDNIRNLSSTLYGFGEILEHEIGNLNQLAEDLTISFKEQSPSKLTSKQLYNLQLRLIKLFENCENLIITYKALTLCYESERIYQNSRILTDIRLVFKDDIKDIKRNAIVIHQLKIETTKDGKQNDIFVSLDSIDLLKFNELVKRAIQKEAQIKDNYKETINFIELTE